ncbi:hypothetical protein I4U23_015217 [Adineta vaga]|nr:hypothetical protein I4U23_015217 [Adineta vaga]
MHCDQPDYVLILHEVAFAASKNSSCAYSNHDCFEDCTALYHFCSGRSICNISSPETVLNSCNNFLANYLHIKYQCIPTRPKSYFNICSSMNKVHTVDGGIIVSSLNYTSASKQCRIQLHSKNFSSSQGYRAFKVYLLNMNLPGRSNISNQNRYCDENDPFVEIDDFNSNKIRLCGTSLTYYLFETCSNILEIRYYNVHMNISSMQYDGFAIYVESIENDQCRLTPPIVVTHQIACIKPHEHIPIQFNCPKGYGLVFLRSSHFITINQSDQCDVTQSICSYLNIQPHTQCSGQESCSYIYNTSSSLQLNSCSNQQPIATDFYYQCLPMYPSTTYPVYTLCRDKQTNTSMGFIETYNYPHTYQFGIQKCSLIISLPNNSNLTNRYSIHIYSIKTSIRTTSIATSAVLCGNSSRPSFQYQTNQNQIKITFHIVDDISIVDSTLWQGAQLFFMIEHQDLPSTTQQMISSSTIQTSTTSVKEILINSTVKFIDTTTTFTSTSTSRPSQAQYLKLVR